MRTHKAQTQALTSSSTQRFPCFSLRKKKKAGVVQGKLRIRSMPGAFLVLGMIVVIVGTTLAVVGYWPYRVQRSAAGSVTKSPTHGTTWGLGAKGLFSTASLIHTDRMKLLGPVIMGVGLFIFICANTVLYENRDKETQILLSEMQSVMCTMSTVPSADFTQVNSLIRHYHWVGSLPAAHLNILCLKELASSEPLLQDRTTKEERMPLPREVMHTKVLRHQESLFISSIHLSDSCNSSKRDISTYLDVEKELVCVQQPQLEGHCNLNKNLTSSLMSTPESQDWELTTVPPRRSHSMSYRTDSQTLSKPLVQLQEKAVLQISSCPKPIQQSCISEVCVNQEGIHIQTPNSDFAFVGDQKHHSWP
ncbi:uncharacterized protein tmem200b [Silurus meridionalis]|uniref:Transmembrane protein 200B n=1 Tax=Silurus meridionalis TaxID=175797 RepID=A0A8T0A5N2_SILME|nr:uncharacterized protein tmem200b [Silurus meridionalis]KAF7686236.1 hypothetical protein HF521_015598 [Silurus meridionalis]